MNQLRPKRDGDIISKSNVQNFVSNIMYETYFIYGIEVSVMSASHTSTIIVIQLNLTF